MMMHREKSRYKSIVTAYHFLYFLSFTRLSEKAITDISMAVTMVHSVLRCRWQLN